MYYSILVISRYVWALTLTYVTFDFKKSKIPHILALILDQKEEHNWCHFSLNIASGDLFLIRKKCVNWSFPYLFLGIHFIFELSTVFLTLYMISYFLYEINLLLNYFFFGSLLQIFIFSMMCCLQIYKNGSIFQVKFKLCIDLINSL